MFKRGLRGLARGEWQTQTLALGVNANTRRVVGSANELNARYFERSLNFEQGIGICTWDPRLRFNRSDRPTHYTTFFGEILS
jgi:hypothetical protein